MMNELMNDFQPLTINLSSSALSSSGCMLRLYRKVVEGYKEPAMDARLVYGVGVHKYIDTMYRTGGDIPKSKDAAREVFMSIPRIDDRKSMHLSDVNHMLAVAVWTWEMCVARDEEFEMIEIKDKCPMCEGTGQMPVVGESTAQITVCPKCQSIGTILRPASEVTFSIPYYKDNFVNINFCGTMDRIGKMKDGIYIIPDWKTTSSWSEREYFKQYEMSKAPRGYVLALKLMHEHYPDSILGRIGGTRVGARFDAVFVKPKVNAVTFARSDVFTYSDQEIMEFRTLLDDKCREISQAVKTGYLPKQGLINGSCQGRWGFCSFWNVCSKPEIVGEVLLKRDFVKKPFNPLAYND